MKLAVLIPTYGRKALVSRLLTHLEGQTRRPDLVVISAPDDRHIEPFETTAFAVEFVFGRTGLTAQRNQALARTVPDFDAVVFFDDDFLPASDYLERLADGFAAHPDWAVATGHVIADGITGCGLTFEDGLRLLAVDAAKPVVDALAVEEFSAYGCNMGFRTAAVGSLRFDERLPLYGWQEDVDFTAQLGRHGRVMRDPHLRGVHLGIKSGRVSGVRFGYSQIINPVYLIRKGTVPARIAIKQISRNVAANLARVLWPEPYVDRRGRLWGNLLGAYHLAKGRIEPEHILEL